MELVVSEERVDDIGFFVFQAMFVATCATIMSGIVAEWIKLGSYTLIVVVMTLFIYPVAEHWLWPIGLIIPDRLWKARQNHKYEEKL